MIKLPERYESPLTLRETEKAIKKVKDCFQIELAKELQLQRVSAPLFVKSGTGVNDDLNGVETKVSFTVKDEQSKAEIVFSLAKWKRMALADYGFKVGEGLYTDMNAIRPDEELDPLHSVYVDQWDWEKIVTKEQRTLEFLKDAVRKIYSTMKKTEEMVHKEYPEIIPILPEEIAFVHTEDLIQEFPALTPKEREQKIAEKHKAVFLIGIGGELKDGTIHDGRAPDYDDWSTPTEDGKKGLNGDIIVWHPILKQEFEISSMGIRVDKEALLRQLEIRKAEERKELEWHSRLIAGELPLCIGGGIGQSRLCMFFLRKAHVGEVQSSIWPEEMITECKEKGIALL